MWPSLVTHKHHSSYNSSHTYLPASCPQLTGNCTFSSYRLLDTPSREAPTRPSFRGKICKINTARPHLCHPPSLQSFLSFVFFRFRQQAAQMSASPTARTPNNPTPPSCWCHAEGCLHYCCHNLTSHGMHSRQTWPSLPPGPQRAACPSVRPSVRPSDRSTAIASPQSAHLSHPSLHPHENEKTCGRGGVCV